MGFNSSEFNTNIGGKGLDCTLKCVWSRSGRSDFFSNFLESGTLTQFNDNYVNNLVPPINYFPNMHDIRVYPYNKIVIDSR